MHLTNISTFFKTTHSKALIRGQNQVLQVQLLVPCVVWKRIFGSPKPYSCYFLVWTRCRLSRAARHLQETDKIHQIRCVMGVTMALLECPPPWNSMVPKASVGLSCVCLLIDHFSDRLSFLARRSALSFWLDEMPGGRPTCWPIRRPQQHLEERRE